MANEGSNLTVHGEEEQRKQSKLEGWSMRVEDLVDSGDQDGAVQLLETVVESLQIRNDADTNLSLAAALTDLGRIYADQGLSLKSDFVLNNALLIKHRKAQEFVDGAFDSKEDKVNAVVQNEPQSSSSAATSRSVANARGLPNYDQLQSSKDSFADTGTEGVREVEDWETALHELPTQLDTPSPTITREARSYETNSSKQRGRGSFTYGAMGMYSDNLEVTADNNGPGDGINPSDDPEYGGASHVLVLEFSPGIKTKDLEDLVKPFSKEGSCSIRWIADTRALAVFSSPPLARDALLGINDVRFKVGMFCESSGITGYETSIKDLAPPRPRPASSARVAQRMIANALSKQGVGAKLVAKNQGSVQEIQKSERQRKERLQSRAQLRDEAWGSDDD